ncbi:MAG: flagellar biosynthesis anti-sigma factor FlgM [Desulfovibrio sp.]|nr:flagellar biosynthesis anti-sigma factor FlgM [Desulfovibrio sp.]
MEIQSKSLLAEHYAASLERSADARGRARNETQREAAAQGDRISVSHDARLLTEAHRTAQNTPDVRASKVDALRLQVADGTYRPDSQRIAAALVREEPGLFRL